MKRCYARKFIVDIKKDWLRDCKKRAGGLCCLDCKTICHHRCNYSRYTSNSPCWFHLTKIEAFWKTLFRKD